MRYIRMRITSKDFEMVLDKKRKNGEISGFNENDEVRIINASVDELGNLSFDCVVAQKEQKESVDISKCRYIRVAPEDLSLLKGE